MEDASLSDGLQRVKFSCNRIDKISVLLHTECDRKNYFTVAKRLADALLLQEKHGLSPVLPDGKVGGNGAVKILISNQYYLLVSKSGKYPGELDLHKDFCVVSHFDRDSWICSYYSEEDDIQPTSDTPMHYGVLFNSTLYQTSFPTVALHGHGLQSEEEARRLNIPCSFIETMCSTAEDSDALVQLIESYPYPTYQVYIRKNHGYYILGCDVEDCVDAFEKTIIRNI